MPWYIIKESVSVANSYGIYYHCVQQYKFVTVKLDFVIKVHSNVLAKWFWENIFLHSHYLALYHFRCSILSIFRYGLTINRCMFPHKCTYGFEFCRCIQTSKAYHYHRYLIGCMCVFVYSSKELNFLWNFITISSIILRLNYAFTIYEINFHKQNPEFNIKIRKYASFTIETFGFSFIREMNISADIQFIGIFDSSSSQDSFYRKFILIDLLISLFLSEKFLFLVQKCEEAVQFSDKISNFSYKISKCSYKISKFSNRKFDKSRKISVFYRKIFNSRVLNELNSLKDNHWWSTHFITKCKYLKYV